MARCCTTTWPEQATARASNRRTRDMSLKGKVALVTGSTSGIGLGIARALGAEGADLMLNGFGDAATIEKLRADMAKQLGVRVLHSGADISKSAEIAAMVAQTQE